MRGLYDIVEPPLPMMQVILYGTKGTVRGEFTDNKPGALHIVFDGQPAKEPLTINFEPERDSSAYGHGATVVRHMRHFQECLEKDPKPSPNEIDGACAAAVAAAAWESVETGKVVKVPR